MHYLFALSLIAAVILVGSVTTASASDNAIKVEGGSCMTGQCHGELQEQKFVHGPISAGECTLCHGESLKHIREAVPFGSWELPVIFQKTDTGGRCTTGCHQEKKI